MSIQPTTVNAFLGAAVKLSQELQIALGKSRLPPELTPVDREQLRWVQQEIQTIAGLRAELARRRQTIRETLEALVRKLAQPEPGPGSELGLLDELLRAVLR